VLNGRRVVGAVAFAVTAATLTSCVSAGRSGPDDQPSQAGGSHCVQPQITVEPVTGMTEKNIYVAGTIKAGGKPLQNQVLRFLIRESEGSKYLWTSGGKTGADGRVAIDMSWALSRGFLSARRGFDKGKVLQIEYTNPADLQQAPPPGWCSTTVTGPFEPSR
jgi:hypothetical protein